MRSKSGNLLILVVVLTGSVGAQETRSTGDGNANISTNNGQVIVNNYFRMPPSVLKELEALSRSQNGWQGKMFPGSDATDYGHCKEDFSRMIKQAAGMARDQLQQGSSGVGIRYVIRLGDERVLCLSLPCAVLAIDHKVVLSLINLGSSVGIVAEFSAEGGKTIASISGNIVHVNQHIAMYFERPDPHTVSVIDQRNREVLWVSLENAHFVHMRAKLIDPSDKVLLDIDDAGLKGPDGSIRASGDCAIAFPPIDGRSLPALNFSSKDGSLEF